MFLLDGRLETALEAEELLAVPPPLLLPKGPKLPAMVLNFLPPPGEEGADEGGCSWVVVAGIVVKSLQIVR